MVKFKVSQFLLLLFNVSAVSVFIYKCRILERYKTFQFQIKSLA